jgi:hypothetical protein
MTSVCLGSLRHQIRFPAWYLMQHRKSLSWDLPIVYGLDRLRTQSTPSYFNRPTRPATETGQFACNRSSMFQKFLTLWCLKACRVEDSAPQEIPPSNCTTPVEKAVTIMRSFTSLLSLCLLALLDSAVAAPALEARQSVTTLSASQVNAYTPYTYYASTAYCRPANTLAWNCGGE